MPEVAPLQNTEVVFHLGVSALQPIVRIMEILNHRKETYYSTRTGME